MWTTMEGPLHQANSTLTYPSPMLPRWESSSTRWPPSSGLRPTWTTTSAALALPVWGKNLLQLTPCIPRSKARQCHREVREPANKSKLLCASPQQCDRSTATKSSAMEEASVADTTQPSWLLLPNLSLRAVRELTHKITTRVTCKCPICF